jgi:hypothetical protein
MQDAPARETRYARAAYQDFLRLDAADRAAVRAFAEGRTASDCRDVGPRTHSAALRPDLRVVFSDDGAVTTVLALTGAAAHKNKMRPAS